MTVPRNRHDAIRAAAKRFATAEDVPYWVDDTYVMGMVELINDTFGSDVDEDDRLEATWLEIVQEHEQLKLEARLEGYIAGVMSPIAPGAFLNAHEASRLIRQAYLAGIQSTKEES